MVVVVMVTIVAMIMVMMMAVMMTVIVMMVPVRADAAHVEMMAGLSGADIRLVANDLRAVLADPAVHHVVAGQDLADPLDEGVEHQRMVVEVVRLDDLDIGMDGGGRV